MDEVTRVAAKERSWHRAARLVAVAVLAFVVVPRLAAGCAVCYGDVDSLMTAGMNNGILVLLAVIAVVQVGFVALFLSIRQRARQLRQRRDRLQVIQGGAG